MTYRPTPDTFPLILLGIILCIIVIGLFQTATIQWDPPDLSDYIVSEDSTLIFHNSVVQNKYIVKKSGFPFGTTEYFVQIDNYTIEIEGTFYNMIIPNATTLGYYVNNETGEVSLRA